MMLTITDKQLLQSKKFIVLYGAGAYGKVYQQLLKQEGLEIACYAVSDGQAIDLPIDGKEIKPLSAISYAPEDTVFILTLSKKYWEEIKKQLEQMGYHCILGFHVDSINNYLKWYIKNIASDKKIEMEQDVIDLGILKINNPLVTQFRDVFFPEAIDLILPYFNDYTFCNEGPYEIEKVEVGSGDIVIDCGANIGIFSTFAAQKGGEVFAFEPMPMTKTYLQKNAGLYPDKIHTESYAVAEKCGESVFFLNDISNGHTLLTGSIDEIGQITVPTITLDQFVKERNLPRVDFIKADIEGAERLMLAGAQETLRRFAPKLAICTYHLPDDKEVLEGLIKQANPDYIVTHRWKKLYAYVPEEKRRQLLKANAAWQEEVPQ